MFYTRRNARKGGSSPRLPPRQTTLVSFLFAPRPHIAHVAAHRYHYYLFGRTLDPYHSPLTAFISFLVRPRHSSFLYPNTP